MASSLGDLAGRDRRGCGSPVLAREHSSDSQFGSRRCGGFDLGQANTLAAELGDWRRKTLSRMRKLIPELDRKEWQRSLRNVAPGAGVVVSSCTANPGATHRQCQTSYHEQAGPDRPRRSYVDRLRAKAEAEAYQATVASNRRVDSGVERPLSATSPYRRFSPTAAVPCVRRKRLLEESGSCREGQLTGLVANSRNRPTEAVQRADAIGPLRETLAAVPSQQSELPVVTSFRTCGFPAHVPSTMGPRCTNRRC